VTTNATLRKSALLGRAALIALAAGAASAALADNETDQPSETIVVTGTKFNTEAAPAKASLDTTEPQTIINKSYIDNFVTPIADYVTILSIVPGMTGGDTNGPGLSDGGAKNTLRGLGDGNFAMQYDGIPFGDTNGPTHHNISYFPASTIGSAVVDRGPGNAGNLGAATYGGTVKLFSPTLSDDPHAMVSATYGSFNTQLEVANLQTGKVDWLGGTKIMLNVQSLGSDGALSLQDVREKNALFKSETPIGTDWKLTMFADYSYLIEHLSDNNGSTPAQVMAFGKDFALQKYDATQPTYQPYNWTHKETDSDYIRLQGDITRTTHFDNTAYTYAYWNHTFSPNTQTQENCAASTATVPCVNGLTNDDTLAATKQKTWYFLNPTSGLINTSRAAPGTDLLAYDKVNEYRVFGDIIRLSQEYDLGWVKGYKYMFDMNACAAANVDPWNVHLDQAAAICGIGPKAGGTVNSEGGKYAFNGNQGYAKDDEYSGWQQYQPFLEVDIKPIDDLTLTPGVKYVHWNHDVNAQVAQGSLCGVSVACPGFNGAGQSFQQSFVTTDTLPFFQANYKIRSNWSTYFEYAKGIYVPDVSAFENSSPVKSGTFPSPELTTNYQLGTVYYADQFTFDADVYVISIDNNYITATDNQGDTYYVNGGKALYKGIEGEGTYAFDKFGDVDLHGLSIFANGALMDSKQTGGTAVPGNNPELYAGKWAANAPRWTFAGGVLFKRDGWKFAVIDKVVGAQFTDQMNSGAGRLPSYNNLNLTAGYNFGVVETSISIDNLLDSRSLINISPGDAADANGSKTVAAFTGSSQSQYFYQAPRSVMGTMKVAF
jgi:iron complex outermembrane receptor protein